MEKITTSTITISLLALIIGLGGGYAFASNKTPEANEHMMANGAMMHNQAMNMGGAMDDMMSGLNGKSGDDFDKAFLSEMVVHHQGAVLMAESALKNAKHQEIKDLAQNIITAQKAEIAEMQGWEKSWYGQ
ncbi:DUF305 domain-containing protein [Patescibacteria group bacterium]|nr:DUF305 domain-containing protein [Patescibacteria group bacterium]MBU1755248.1 DUF305 domain-containing protein [Patescibacteria group bacterium]